MITENKLRKLRKEELVHLLAWVVGQEEVTAAFDEQIAHRPGCLICEDIKLRLDKMKD